MNSSRQGFISISEFLVDENDVQLVEEPGLLLDYRSDGAEALRVVGSMPRWIPGKRNGKCIRVRYRMPVTFRL